MTNPDRNPSTDPSFGARVRWPVLVVVLLAGHVLLLTSAVMFGLSISGGFASPEDYGDSLGWDERQSERRASDALGWRLEALPSDTIELNGDRKIALQLSDRHGEPIEGASLELRIYHHARADQAQVCRPAPEPPGGYAVILPMRRAGAWSLNAVATRGDERFVTTQDLWISEQRRPRP